MLCCLCALYKGSSSSTEPCPSNFTRIGSKCYHFSPDAVNWKSASYACRKLKANLLELDADGKRRFAAGVQADQRLKGTIPSASSSVGTFTSGRGPEANCFAPRCPPCSRHRRREGRPKCGSVPF